MSTVRQREQRYAAAFEACRDILLFIDHDGKILDANPICYQLYPHLQREGSDANFFDQFCSDLIAERMRVAFSAALQAGDQVIVEDEQESKILSYSINPLPSAEGDDKELLIVIREIPEPKRPNNEMAVFRSAILESIPASVIIVDSDMRLVGWNSFSRDTINGSNDEKMCGLNPFDRVHPDDLPAVQRAFLNVLDSDSEDTVEFRMYHNEGPPYKWAMGRGKRLVIDGRSSVVAVVTETTELKRAQEEKESLKAQLQQSQKMDMLGRLVGGIAHDFNNALMAILGNTEMLCDQIDKNHPFFEKLESIRISANSTADLVRQLLAFAKLQAQCPKVLELDETLNELRPMFTKLIRESIDLRWRLESRNARVRIDPYQLMLVITNMCINSSDAIRDVGMISIATVQESVTAADCLGGHVCRTPGDYIRLSLADNGHGIESEQLPRIFEPFFTSSEFGKRAGLGLSMVYGIITQNGGYIECRSEIGKGTLFNLYFSRHAEEVLTP